jgi:hypothetical protein
MKGRVIPSLSAIVLLPAVCYADPVTWLLETSIYSLLVLAAGPAPGPVMAFIGGKESVDADGTTILQAML